MSARFISSKDTVALFDENGAESWRGELLDYFLANGIAEPRDVLAVVDGLEAGAHRTGGGAAPIFDLRLIACAL